MRTILVVGACSLFAAVGVYDLILGSPGIGIASIFVAAANALYLTA